MDYFYLAESLASFTGLPVRIYLSGKFAKLYHPIKFKPDLAITEEAHIFCAPGTVSYYVDNNFLYYGLLRVKAADVSLVIGPIAQTAIDHAMAIRILRAMGEKIDRAGEVIDYFSAMPAYPLRNFLQMLCTINYCLNEEKTEAGQLLLGEEPVPPLSPPPIDRKPDMSAPHNTLELEDRMLSYVEHGQVAEVLELFQQPLEGRAGRMAADTLRQEKNLIICAATLITRAAIRGGLNRETAFVLSDTYIQKAELMLDYAGLARLSAQMVLDFTKRVDTAKCGPHNSKLIRAARNYIFDHINEQILTDALASFLRMNRTYLCNLFMQETGMTVNHYIANVKIDEAKRLMQVTHKSIAEISEYLGFSSQSYFQKKFKKYTGVTPREYRINNCLHI